MDLDSTNGTFINVRFLVICGLIFQIYWPSFDSSVMRFALFLYVIHLCREIALNLVVIMSYLKRTQSSLAIVGMILTNEEHYCPMYFLPTLAIVSIEKSVSRGFSIICNNFGLL